MRKLKNKDLQRISIEEFKKTNKIPVTIILDNVRSALNVGSIFVAMLLAALILYAAAWGSKFINLTISTVMSRVVGILLAAIAIQTILNGLTSLGIINI